MLHGCRQLVPWGVGLSPATSATLILCYLARGSLRKLPAMSWRKVGTTSSHHGPYVQGYTRATMATTEGSKTARWSQSLKVVVVGIGVCNSTP